MYAKADIVFGVDDQTIVVVAREGRPSSIVSAQVFEDIDSDNDPDPDAVASSSIDTSSATLDGAAGESQSDPTRIPVASTAALTIGSRYLITNSHGRKEWVDVDAIASGDAAYAAAALANDYTTGDVMRSTAMVVTLDDDWVAEEDNVSDPLSPRPRYRLVVKYVVDGQTYVSVAYFDLVRYPFTHSVTPQDVDRLSRGWLFRLATDDQAANGQHVIDEAVHQVKLDLWERGVTAYALRNSDVVNELIRLRAVWIVSAQAFREGGISQLAMELDAKNYWDRVANLVSSAQAQIQVTADGAGSTAPRTPASRR